jgi:hypothetical protein
MEAVVFTNLRTPELLTAYKSLGADSQSGVSRQPFKGWDLWRLLEQVKPKSIAEMGSGTTSAVFALWAKNNKTKYVAFEHHDGWSRTTIDAIEKAGLKGSGVEIRCVPSRVSDGEKSTWFVENLPADIDFIYVDGPPCKLDNGKKVANDDVVRLFDRGGRPSAIVVDGRIDTVDLILSHEASKDYTFYPSMVYSMRKNNMTDALSGREHSLFIRKK